ncbi:MAG: hypothetical protein WC916_03295 [Candidatus Woesearchaeota archaeon]
MKNNPSTNYILAIVAIVFIVSFTTFAITVADEKQTNANDAVGNPIAVYSDQAPQEGMEKFIVHPDGTRTPLK